MKRLKLFPAIVVLVFLFNNSIAQPWQTAGNIITTTEFLGANATSTIPLELKTIPALAINFTTNSIQRGTILPNGFWGISNGAFTPQSKLHINGGAGGVFSQWTNNATGNLTVNDGLRIGVNAGGIGLIENFEPTPIRILTNSPPNHVLRMLIGFDGINRTRVGIGQIGQPRTYLHLGGPMPTTTAGYRSWMNVGVLMANDTTGAPDNMYVGLRQYAVDSVEAIINWGNNPSNTNALGDRLRFVFTGSAGNGQASTFDGLEFGRMVCKTIGAGLVREFIGWGNFLNQPDPGNTVEINSPALNPNLLGGSSGMRYRDLTSITPPIFNPGQGVLGVDLNGDVIYVQLPPSSGFAGPCPTTATTTLASDFGTNLGGFNFYWEGNGAGSGVNNMILGKNCSVAPLAKLDILQSSGTGGSTGLNLLNTDGGTCIGIKSVVTNPGTVNTAGWFEAVLGATFAEYSLFTPPNSGIWSIGHPFGIFIGSLNLNPVLLQVNGNIDALGLQNNSDQALKTNVQPIQSAIQKIKSISGVSFYWDTTSYPQYNFQRDRQLGFIAQNLDTVIPEVVEIGGDGFLRVDYSKVIPILVNGIKEQQVLIDSLFGIVNSNTRQTWNQNNQIISLESDVILYQNAPNPFSDETTIGYFIPDNASSARMLFYDETGRVIKEETLQALGNGTVTVETTGLASGIYTYALEVNGKILQIRKMQKVK